ncbi:hypothetical protein F4823DRAFT_169670 [Ustulina deusta]|nr:hypothetical protein F4823DRAFT_169670 [Ustulina deusta]
MLSLLPTYSSYLIRDGFEASRPTSMSGISGSNALAFGSTSWASLGSAGVLVALLSSQIMRLVVYRDLDVKELVTIICLDRARYPVHTIMYVCPFVMNSTVAHPCRIGDALRSLSTGHCRAESRYASFPFRTFPAAADPHRVVSWMHLILESGNGIYSRIPLLEGRVTGCTVGSHTDRPPA